MSRRRFLKLTATVAAVTGLPFASVAQALEASDDAARAAAELTTLARTFGPGSPNDLGYRPVVEKPGQPRVVRDDLAAPRPRREERRRSLVCFAHLTDQHIIDVQSTTRVEFLDRYADGECGNYTFFSSAHRPQESANARMADAMLQRLRRIGVSPVTGSPIQAAICTGDNTDNQQGNELEIFLGVMNGGRVTPHSGDPTRYEGVQRSGDPAYWHPDGDVEDRYRRVYGFPVLEGWLEAALEPFDAVGAGLPWYSAYGNHDGLAQGNSPVLPAYEVIAEGPLKVVGPPPGTDPCNELDDLGFLPAAPTQPTTADAGRQYIDRAEWVRRHLEAGGVPGGHGFTQANVDQEIAYYTADVGGVRWIVLDTVNPGGHADGSIGDRQLRWLDEQLATADQERRLVLLFSHHGPRSLNNRVESPDPTREPEWSDLPRHKADDVLDVVLAHPSAIGWVNGHSHLNTIQTYTAQERGLSGDGQLWSVGTAAHIDWPHQARIVEVVDNRDGTLSIFGTLFDMEDVPMAAQARELGANDPQKGFGYGEGAEEDRNVELLIRHPFRGASPQPAAEPAAEGRATPPPARPGGPMLPATGVPGNLSVSGALAVAAAVGVRRLAERAHAIEQGDRGV